MVYYECIQNLQLYKKHEVIEVKVICENPMFAVSPWLEIRTREGKTFYLEKKTLDFMNENPQCFPLEERKRHVISA